MTFTYCMKAKHTSGVRLHAADNAAFFLLRVLAKHVLGIHSCVIR